MKVKVFESNHNGKIEFTRAELEKLLNEVYNDGYNEGKSSHWTWTSPSISTTPYYASTSTNSANKAEAVVDNSLATASVSTNKTVNTNPSYTVKVNGTDISKLVNDIFGAGTSKEL